MSTETGLSESVLRLIAEELFNAHRDGRPIDPPSTTRGMGAADAVVVRRMLAELHVAGGHKHCGYKIGFTSKVMQDSLGIREPEFGFLFDDYILGEADPVVVSKFCETCAEPEIAFEMAHDLCGPATIEDVLDAVECVRPAIEIVDSRCGLRRSQAADMVADNVLAARAVLGSASFGPRDVELDRLPVTIETDGESLSGMTSDVMGHPAASVAWLARRLSETGGLDGSIKAGSIIMSGSSTKYVRISAGNKLTADFGALGSIRLEFV